MPNSSLLLALLVAWTHPQTFKKKFTGFESRVFQHEYDHLDGVVYIDRLIDEEERELVQERLNELVAEFGDGGVL